MQAKVGPCVLYQAHRGLTFQIFFFDISQLLVHAISPVAAIGGVNLNIRREAIYLTLLLFRSPAQLLVPHSGENVGRRSYRTRSCLPNKRRWPRLGGTAADDRLAIRSLASHWPHLFSLVNDLGSGVQICISFKRSARAHFNFFS
jgi:hypothetical protein